MSIPSRALRTSVSDHNSLPVFSSRANAAVAVAPYTRPPATTRPLGPWSGDSKSFVQITVPVCRSIARTLDSRSCAKITPPAITGAEEKLPYRLLAVSGSVHATPSRDTLARSIEVLASRVLAGVTLG